MPLEDESFSVTPPNVQGLKEGAALAYSSNTPIRAAMQAVPYVGGALDTLLGAPGQEIERKRVVAMFNFLAQELTAVKETAIRKDWLGSEQAYDVLVEAIAAARRSRGEARLRVLARVLRGAMTGELEAVADPEDLLDALGGLNDEQLDVLQAGFEATAASPDSQPFFQTKHIANRLSGPARDRLAFNLQRIAHTGILQEVTGALVGYSGGGYHLTVVGQRLQTFVTAHPAS
jgi:hypothetical protein